MNMNTGSITNSKNILFENNVDFKDFPALKNMHKFYNKNQSSINEKLLNEKSNKLTKSYTSLFSYNVDSEKYTNLNEAFPKLANFNLKKNQSEVTDTKIKQECTFEDSEVKKCETPFKLKLQTGEVTKNEERKLNPNTKVPVQQKRNPNKKKRSEPIFFNIGEVLELNSSLKKMKQTKKKKSKFQRSSKKEVIGGNFLDSSNPKRKRGKHREIKKKKHTNLKLAIIRERIIKQKIKEKNISDFCDENCMQLINNIDFKTEIEKYLSNLKIKKYEKSKINKKEMQVNVNSITSTLEILNINEENELAKSDQEKIIESKVKDNYKQLKANKMVDKCSLPAYSNKTIKFSSKFREYCNNIVTPHLNIAVSELIKNLIDLQDRVFAKDPIKAKVRKRHVSGLREVKKYLTIKKVKMVIIAPNLEKLQMEGSVYDIIKELKLLCDNQNVPYVFALDRYKLGRCTKKNVPVSAFAVLNYEGIEDRFKSVLKHLEDAKKEFSDKMPDKEIVDSNDVNIPIMSSLLSVFKEKKKVEEAKAT